MNFWSGLIIGWAVCTPLTVCPLLFFKGGKTVSREQALADFNDAVRRGDGGGQARAWRTLQAVSNTPPWEHRN